MSDHSEEDWQFTGRKRQSAPSPPTRTMADVLFLSELERSLVNWLLRQKSATLAEIAAYLTHPLTATETLLNELIAQGFVKSVETQGEWHYQPRLITRKGRQVPTDIWSALDS